MGGKSEQLRGELLSRAGATSAVYAGVLHKPRIPHCVGVTLCLPACLPAYVPFSPALSLTLVPLGDADNPTAAAFANEV